MQIPVGPLIRLSEATAAAIAERVDLSPQAKQLLASGVSSSDYVKSLAKQGLSNDAAGFLAHGLEKKRGVQWAAESAKLVADKLPPEELKAMQVAQAWTGGATGEAELQQALGETKFDGPGSWAAQAALWTAKALEFAPPGGVAGPLAPKAIDGAVKLAAAINQGARPQSLQPVQQPGQSSLPTAAATQMMEQAIEGAATPLSAQDQAALNTALEPFVELGLRLAAG